MPGFFSIDETAVPDDAHSRTLKCGVCRLNRTCISPCMEASGDGGKGILIIGSAPDEEEDKHGSQCLGRGNQYLQNELSRLGIDMEKDCRRVFAVNCYPPKGRSLSSTEVEACRPLVWREIKNHPPKLILVLGAAALQSFLGHRTKKALGGFGRWCGWETPDRDTGAWSTITFHPNMVQRHRDDVMKIFFRQDLEQAISLLHRSPPQYKREQDCVEVLSENEAISALEFLIKSPRLISIDYETTGLKPHRKGHQIVSCAISDDGESGISFMVDGGVVPALKKVLNCEAIRKIAANKKFEEIWSRVILGTEVRGWVFDSMLAAHVLDNRRGVTGLKFQAYVKYGIADYNSHIAPFLEGTDPQDSNSFNRILSLDPREILVYGGIDAILEHRLALDQDREMGGKAGLL